MKAVRITVVVLILTVLFGGFQFARADIQPNIRAEAAVLMDANTGRILYEKNADKIMYPASTTKVITALVAVEHGDLDEVVTVGSEVNMIAWDSSRAHLQPGDKISLRDLLYGLMLASGNDAAYATAVHIARTVSGEELSAAAALKEFADMMNQRAQELGALNTNFVNPDGYPDSRHYTTARDLALITAGAMANQDYRELDSTPQHTPETWAGSTARAWSNGNALINPGSSFYYDKAIGGKTGFTYPAGFCMVATANHNEMGLVAVALKTDANGRWQDTTALLEFGFENFSRETLAEAGEVVATVKIADSRWTQDLIITEDYIDTFHGFDSEGLETKLRLDPKLAVISASTPTLKAPIDAGETVGELIFSLEGVELHRAELTVAENIRVLSWLRRLFSKFRAN